MLHLLNKQTEAILLSETKYLGIGHLHDGIILLPRLECFVKMLFHSNLSSILGIKAQLEKISLTIKTTEQHSVLGSKMTRSFK